MERKDIWEYQTYEEEPLKLPPSVWINQGYEIHKDKYIGYQI